MKYLIIGLGNIGDEYANTRHNIGFIVLDAVAQLAHATFKIDRYAYVTRVKYKSRIFVLIKPTTYMNLSGKAVKYWLNKEKVPLEKTLVVVDDTDLALGTLRMKAKGSGGSHNGLNNIIEMLGTTDFPRLRFGIGNDFARGFKIDYVLGKWSKKEEKILIPRVKQAVEMIKSFGTLGIEQTMSEFNNN